MRIILNEVGRVVVVFNADEVMPVGGFFVRDVIELFSERYQFEVKPKPTEVENGATFREGIVSIGGARYPIKELVAYRDGFAVNSFDTDAAGLIMKDIIEWAKPTFGMREPVTIPILAYENAVVFEFEGVDAGGLFSVFETMQAGFSSAIRESYGVDANTHLVSLSFGLDPNDPARASKSPFLIHRRLGFPYTKNRFYSVAPLRTQAHHKLLDSIESSLKQ